jgi:hypothetical protein
VALLLAVALLLTAQAATDVHPGWGPHLDPAVRGDGIAEVLNCEWGRCRRVELRTVDRFSTLGLAVQPNAHGPAAHLGRLIRRLLMV